MPPKPTTPPPDSGTEGDGPMEIVIALYDATEADDVAMKQAAAGIGAEAPLKDYRQVLAVWFRWENPDGGYFAEELSGWPMFACIENDDGCELYRHDPGGGGSTHTKQVHAAGGATPWRQLDSKLASAAMGGGATWDTFDGGDSGTYDSLLSIARTRFNALP